MKVNNTIKAVLMAAFAAAGLTLSQAQAATAQQMQTAIGTAKSEIGYNATTHNVYALTFSVDSYQAFGSERGFILQLVAATSRGKDNNGLYLITNRASNPTILSFSSDDNNLRSNGGSTVSDTTWLSGTNVYTSTPSGTNYGMYGNFSKGANGSTTNLPTLAGATFTVAYDGTNTTLLMTDVNGITNKAVFNNCDDVTLDGISFYLQDDPDSGKIGNTAINAGTLNGVTNVYTWDGAAQGTTAWNTATWKLAAIDGQNFKNVTSGTAYDAVFSKEGAAASVNSDVRAGKVSVDVDQTIAAENGATATFASTDVADGKALTLTSDSNGTINLGNVTLGDAASMSVDAADGNLTVRSAENNLHVADMTIGEGKNVGAYQGTADSIAAVTIGNTLTAGGATLTANLTMANGSELNLGADKVLTMGSGSSFNIAEGGIVNLDAGTLAILEGLELDASYMLVGFASSALTNIVDGDWARNYFNLDSITDADYKMTVEGNSISVTKVSNVPEPATGTLSLLALAALAARRRRN